jgi:uracil-DNA glycosylase
VEQNIHPSWENIINKENEKEYFKSLINFVKSNYRSKTCYPPINLIFQAFKICPFDSLKVVILGQDPYHGKSQANGLSFSVSKTTNLPPSLINIFKEIQDDVNVNYPKYGDLSSWGKQGVLLLNSTLTVEEGRPGSHQKKGWEKFTDEIIKHISNNKKNIVFMLWGNYSKMKSELIDRSKHLILTSGHPSPMSANRGYWFGNKHFSKANKYIIKKRGESIQWDTP